MSIVRHPQSLKAISTYIEFLRWKTSLVLALQLILSCNSNLQKQLWVKYHFSMKFPLDKNDVYHTIIQLKKKNHQSHPLTFNPTLLLWRFKSSKYPINVTCCCYCCCCCYRIWLGQNQFQTDQNWIFLI